MRSSAGPGFQRPFDRADAAVLLGLTVLSATLLLANLGNQYLWQDEAQTALLARSVLEHGIPQGTDGTNSFSQERGVEIAPDGVWRWHTWLSFYVTAASFAPMGSSSCRRLATSRTTAAG